MGNFLISLLEHFFFFFYIIILFLLNATCNEWKFTKHKSKLSFFFFFLGRRKVNHFRTSLGFGTNTHEKKKEKKNKKQWELEFNKIKRIYLTISSFFFSYCSFPNGKLSLLSNFQVFWEKEENIQISTFF